MGQGQAYCMVNPKNKNGFKVMNDQRELMRLMLPEVNNVGEQYKQLVDKKRVQEEEQLARDREAQISSDDAEEDNEEAENADKEEESKKSEGDQPVEAEDAL